MNLVDRIEQLLEELAGQQAIPDAFWREKWADLRGELEDTLIQGRGQRTIDIQGVRRQAAPTGSVTVWFHDTSSTLRYNAGGANDGWWWEGHKISETVANELLTTTRIRAIVKS